MRKKNVTPTSDDVSNISSFVSSFSAGSPQSAPRMKAYRSGISTREAGPTLNEWVPISSAMTVRMSASTCSFQLRSARSTMFIQNTPFRKIKHNKRAFTSGPLSFSRVKHYNYNMMAFRDGQNRFGIKKDAAEPRPCYLYMIKSN